MTEFLVTFLQLLSKILYFAIFGRIILSWIDPQGGMRVTQILYEITEPVLGPIRRLMPQMGMLDLSPIVAFILLSVLEQVLVGALVR